MVAKPTINTTRHEDARFFRKGAFQEIFPGMPEEQAESIKDLLMNFPQDMLITKEPDKSVKKELSNTIEKTKES